MDNTTSLYFQEYIRNIEDFPKKGIVFRDISPLLGNPKIFKEMIEKMSEDVLKHDVDAIAAIDARGFIFGTAVAFNTSKSLIMVRKKGKLPGKTQSVKYSYEYDDSILEIQQQESELKNKNIVVVDDVLATGESFKATCKLLSQQGANVKAGVFAIELVNVVNKDGLETPYSSIVKY